MIYMFYVTVTTAATDTLQNYYVNGFIEVGTSRRAYQQYMPLTSSIKDLIKCLIVNTGLFILSNLTLNRFIGLFTTVTVLL